MISSTTTTPPGSSTRLLKSWISNHWGSQVRVIRLQVRPSYHPAVLLQIYIYCYLNRRAQLSSMARAARDAMGKTRLKAIADRGYFRAQEIKACAEKGIAAILPKPTTSSAKAGGRFDRADFSTLPETTNINVPPANVQYTASPEKSMDCSYAAIGVVHVLSTPCGLNARRVRTGASPDGSMRKRWRPSSAESTRHRMQ